MAHFLISPKSEHLAVGFSLLEEFECPNCKRVVLIATSANRTGCNQNIVLGRNTVTAQCPNHDLPSYVACVPE